MSSSFSLSELSYDYSSLGSSSLSDILDCSEPTVEGSPVSDPSSLSDLLSSYYSSL